MNGAYNIEPRGQWNVDMGSGVMEVLSQSVIDEIYIVVGSDHEVIRLDITMYVVV